MAPKVLARLRAFSSLAFAAICAGSIPCLIRPAHSRAVSRACSSVGALISRRAWNAEPGNRAWKMKVLTPVSVTRTPKAGDQGVHHLFPDTLGGELDRLDEAVGQGLFGFSGHDGSCLQSR